VSLPRFLDRVVDATTPVLGGLDREEVRAKLDGTSVRIVVGDRAGAGASRAGCLLAANLFARLYPGISVQGRAELVRAAENEILLVNPRADVGAKSHPPMATLAYETEAHSDATVSVSARGWNVFVDAAADGDVAPAAAAALAAAVIGVGELFRVVFAAELAERGRYGPQPGSFNLVTLGDPMSLPVAESLHVGKFRLVGAGAIGQAAAHTLAVSGTCGTMAAIDHETVAVSNLQRYVLTRDTDVGAVKVDLLRERLTNSGIDVVPVAAEWRAGLVEDQLPTLVALDSPEARIGVQGSLPGPLYNAWTQPADVGWSRHERFGEQPCLACLYWPEHEAPNRHEQIAAAFRQHPLRVLAYLVLRLPVGLPIPPGGIPVVPGLEAPTDAQRWLTIPLVDDLAGAAGVDTAELAAWRERPLADVYQDGVCGGALLHLGVGEAPREVLVPLAHQSALAGVMLATELLVAKDPELSSARADAIEARYDVLVGLPQVLARPRARTDGCLCGDPVFRDVYGRRVDETLGSDPAAEAEDEVG